MRPSNLLRDERPATKLLAFQEFHGTTRGDGLIHQPAPNPLSENRLDRAI